MISKMILILKKWRKQLISSNVSMKIKMMTTKKILKRKKMRILIQVLISITIVIILPRIKFSIQLRKKRRNINVKSILKRKKFLRNIERTFCKAIMISSRRKIHLWIFRITHGNFKDRNYIQDICQN